MNAELLTLPWQVQIALGTGYAAYIVANIGNRAHHKPVDIAFSALVFGLFASIFYGLAAAPLGEIPGGLVAFVGAVVLAACGASWGGPSSEGPCAGCGSVWRTTTLQPWPPS